MKINKVNPLNHQTTEVMNNKASIIEKTEKSKLAVYFCTNVETVTATTKNEQPAVFKKLNAAIKYVKEQSKGMRKADPRDNTTDGTSRVCWWEIYEGGIVLNPGTDHETLNQPIYTSPVYYNE